MKLHLVGNLYNSPMFQSLFTWLPPLHVRRPLLRLLAIFLAYAIAVAVLEELWQVPDWSAGNEVATLFGLVIGMMLAFRNNAANERWWEARKLWGMLNNDSRNLLVKARAYALVESVEMEQFFRHVVGFAHALRLHLRGQPGLRQVPGFEQEPDFPYAPGYLAGQVLRQLADWDRRGKLREALLALDAHARNFLDVAGGCERIKNTPLASSYRALLRWGIVVYLLAAPWSVFLETGAVGIIPLTIAFGILFGVELTAEAVEEPFGLEGDDLPLEKYCEGIEAFAKATLVEPRLGPLMNAK